MKQIILFPIFCFPQEWESSCILIYFLNHCFELKMVYWFALYVCCVNYWTYNTFSIILGSKKRRETLWSSEKDWACRIFRNNPWSWDINPRRALFLLKDGSQKQKLRASWKTRNLPRCNFEHASALEKASNFESGGEDIFSRGG